MALVDTWRPAPPSGTRRTAVPPSPTARPPAGRDRFLDTAKAVAVVRVLAWHTWAWWPLSWFAAMPVMFCASGVLLDGSLSRHGYLATLRARLRRLLVPFWAYAVVAVALMVHGGWRPDIRSLAGWMTPLVDPTGPARFAPLWIPLWYVRAYLWFLISAPLWRHLSRSRTALALCAAIALAATGTVGVPMAVRDFLVFGCFVAIGMRWATRGYPSPHRAAWAFAVTAPVAVAVAAFGRPGLVVNASYALHGLVGATTLAGALALAPRLRTLSGVSARMVDGIGSRSLSIYLWQGVGLYAAARWVPVRHGIGGALAAGVVVATVTAAAVGAFGRLEDLAAGRRRQRAVSNRSSRLDHRAADPLRGRSRAPARGLVPRSIAILATLAVFAGLSMSTEALDAPALARAGVIPPSGQAVVAQGRLTAEALNKARTAISSDGPVAPERSATEIAQALDTAVAEWYATYRATLDEAGLHWLVGSVVAPDGTTYSLSAGAPPPGRNAATPFTLWSMTKAVTGAWLASAAADGTVSLDDPLARWVPEAPRAKHITLAMLAYHAAGLPFDAPASPDEGNEDVGPRAELERFSAHPEFVAPPGKKFTYSRLGYFYLALALERATGEAWSERVLRLADAAGVHIAFDDDPPVARAAPGDRTYHGQLWASGGIIASPKATAIMYRYLFEHGLSDQAHALATDFVDEFGTGTVGGLGVGPNCGRCVKRHGTVIAERYGTGSYSGMWSHDVASGATAVVHADDWYDASSSPLTSVYELVDTVLDIVAPRR